MDNAVLKIRDTRIDSIKYFLMIGVIVEHMVYVNFTGHPTYAVFEFFMSFTMPAFVFLSGYCFKKKPDMGGVKDIANLLVVYGIFQLLYCGQLVGEGTMPSAYTKYGLWISVRYFYRPSTVLWYVVALAIWRIFMYIIPEKWMNWRILLIAIIASLLVGIVPVDFAFAFQRTFAFFPIFLLGYILKSKPLSGGNSQSYIDRIRGINHWLCGVIVVGYLCVFLFGPEIPRCMFTQRCYYSQEGMTIYYRLLFYCMALPITISIINLVPDVKFFAQEGENTMMYYIYHPFIVYLFSFMSIRGLGIIPSSLTFIFLYSIICIGLCCLLARIPFLNFLCNPLKYKRNSLKEKHNNK